MLNPTVAGITLRATLGRRRAILFAIPAAILIALTLILRASHPDSVSWPDNHRARCGRSGSWVTSASRCCCRSPR